MYVDGVLFFRDGYRLRLFQISGKVLVSGAHLIMICSVITMSSKPSLDIQVGNSQLMKL